MMGFRRWAYVAVLCVGALAVTPFLVGAASAKAPKPSPLPAPPKVSPPKGAPTISSPSTPFSCGAVVTVSITLTADANCSGNNAIIIGASSITINLNGHTLSGDGTHFGVVNGSGFTGVVVQNGVIDHFQFGLVLEGNSNKAMSVRVQDNTSYGIYALGNSDVISGNYSLANADGLVDQGGSSVQLTKNVLESNTQYGLYAVGLPGMTVSGNNALNNGSVGIVTGFDSGSLIGNVANGNGASGIFLENPGTGFKPGVTATGNRAAFNAALGIESTPGGSVDGGGNVVQDNATPVQCTNIVCHEVST